MSKSGGSVDFSMSPIGVSGLPQLGGWIFDDFLHELQGSRGRRVYREMADNDPVIGAILFALKMLIRQIEWHVAPGTDDAAGEEIADFVDTCLHDMTRSWPDLLAEILSFLPYGWDVHEMVYKRRDGVNSKQSDGKIGWDSWQQRGQETLQRWEFEGGDAITMVQLGPPDYIPHYIPLSKCLHFRASTDRNSPEGRSVLRNSFRPWLFKKRIEQLEAIGIERDLAGLPVAKVPMEVLASDANAQEKALRDTIFQIVTNIKRDENEGVVWPLVYDDKGNELFKLELLSTGGERSFDTDKIVSRYEQRITMTVMADMIMLGHENVGSQALATEKGALFQAALGAWVDSICGVINEHAIPQLLRLNGLPTQDMPTLEHGDIARDDLDLLSNFVLRLRQAGFLLDTSPDGELTKHLLAQARLPEPPEDGGTTTPPQDVLKPVTAPAGPTDNPSPNEKV